MELACSGLGRTVRFHELGLHNKVRARLFDDPKAISCKRDKESGDLELSWSKTNIRLNGDYYFKLRISREEAAHLFVAAFKDCSLDQCLDELRKARRTKEQETADQRAASAAST